MPFYCYKCDACKETFTVRHGMFFEQERCIKCHRSGHLFKVPDIAPKEDTPEARVGDVVESFIQSSRRELEEQKNDCKKEEKK